MKKYGKILTHKLSIRNFYYIKKSYLQSNGKEVPGNWALKDVLGTNQKKEPKNSDEDWPLGFEKPLKSLFIKNSIEEIAGEVIQFHEFFQQLKKTYLQSSSLKRLGKNRFGEIKNQTQKIVSIKAEINPNRNRWS